MWRWRLAAIFLSCSKKLSKNLTPVTCSSR
jgi:hypothetical protein